MFDKYRAMAGVYGDNMRDAMRNQSEEAMEFSFADSLTYREVVINKALVPARVIQDIDPHTDNEGGTYKIQFRKGMKYPVGETVLIPDDDGIYSAWIITTDTMGSFTIFPKQCLGRCNYELRFMSRLNDGKIVSVPAVLSSSATANKKGEGWNGTMTLGSSEYLATIQLNEETRELRSGDRFLIGIPGGNIVAYRVTVIDYVSHNYGNGLIKMVLYETQLHEQKDNIDLLVADYYDADEEFVTDSIIHYEGDGKLRMGVPEHIILQRDGALSMEYPDELNDEAIRTEMTGRQITITATSACRKLVPFDITIKAEANGEHEELKLTVVNVWE